MPATGFSRIAPGTAAAHTVLGTRLTAIESAINALPIEAVEPHSLTRQHLPTTVVGTPTTAVLDNAIGAESIYSSLVGAEPYPGWNTVAGWKVVNDVGTATGPNTLTVSSLGVLLSTTTSIEVWAEIEAVDIELWDFTGAARAGAVGGAARVYGVFAIQYSNDAATWYHLARTERYFDAESADDATNLVGVVAHQTVDQQNRRPCIATRIRSTDPGGAITVNHVRMVVSCHAGAFAPPAAATSCRVRLRKGRISAFGKRHGTLT